jgi:hypothetical protein
VPILAFDQQIFHGKPLVVVVVVVLGSELSPATSTKK